jgi:copper chaperone NosL
MRLHLHSRLLHVAALTLAALVAVALSPGRSPAALDEGRPACDYCRMLFEDPQFGAELTLGSGRKKIYDSVECLASAVLTDSVAARDVRALTLVDHARPGTRVSIDAAVFRFCPALPSPMGQSLLAFRTRAEADSTCPAPSGTPLDWRGVLARVNHIWFQDRLAVEPHVKFPRLKPSPKPAH